MDPHPIAAYCRSFAHGRMGRFRSDFGSSSFAGSWGCVREGRSGVVRIGGDHRNKALTIFELQKQSNYQYPVPPIVVLLQSKSHYIIHPNQPNSKVSESFSRPADTADGWQFYGCMDCSDIYLTITTASPSPPRTQKKQILFRHDDAILCCCCSSIVLSSFVTGGHDRPNN
jgi:hypothetical protein